MDENELRELFKATNTAEPLCEGWPGLLRFGLAVAEAEREACAKVCEEESGIAAEMGHERFARYSSEMASKIRMRSTWS